VSRRFEIQATLQSGKEWSRIRRMFVELPRITLLFGSPGLRRSMQRFQEVIVVLGLCAVDYTQVDTSLPRIHSPIL
jgi:hypothetical protein